MNIFTYLAPNLHDQKILITVKTYPNLSGKNGEFVCIAGISPEGNWLRIFPIRFRDLQELEQFSKYQWIRLNLTKNPHDNRRESYHPVADEKPELEEILSTKDNWRERKNTIFKTDIYQEFTEPIRLSKKIHLSLITFKPAEITDFSWEETDREWSEKQKAYFRKLDQFENKPELTNFRKLPYKFYYHFLDKDGLQHKMMIEDWETGMLFWNCLEKWGTEEKALKLIKNKYLEEFAQDRDCYFYLGTSQKHHFIANNPFLIVGLFTPPKVDCEQMELEF